ncbi:MAG: Mur ligase domain-containing protein, partial [Bacteroidia bacterium]
MKPKIHLIAIGGSVMHNLARALHANGYEVTGSDDEIHEPSYTRLKTQGLLPAVMGWDTNRIHKDIKAVS